MSFSSSLFSNSKTLDSKVLDTLEHCFLAKWIWKDTFIGANSDKNSIFIANVSTGKFEIIFTFPESYVFTGITWIYHFILHNDQLWVCGNKRLLKYHFTMKPQVEKLTICCVKLMGMLRIREETISISIRGIRSQVTTVCYLNI